jgi:uncharacterized protein YjbI with pentapeptide repeats
LLALDFALVWTLWPGYRSGWGVHLRPKAAWWLAVPGIASAAALAYAAMVATFPDERIYVATDWLHGSTHLNPYTDEVSSPDRPTWYALIAPINTLDLHGEDLIDDTKLAHIIEKNESSTGAERWVATLLLKGRDLTGADLSEADVRHVDFTGAILNRANLRGAWANKATFDNAQLHGAWLASAQLQGASLHGAQLQGAALVDAQLQGAWLAAAQLHGASLENAQLQGATLVNAQLQGARLDIARLQRASFDSAGLQSASLDGAQLQGASFVDVCAWRADARQAAWKDTRVARPETGPKADKVSKCTWTTASFAELKQIIAKEGPEGNWNAIDLEKIEQSLDPTKSLEGEDEMAKIWAAREREAPTPEVYEQSLAEQWRKTGCAAEGAPYVLHGLVARLSGRGPSPFRDQSGWAKDLASDFLYENCAGALGLSEADKAKLKKIAPVRLRVPMR